MVLSHFITLVIPNFHPFCSISFRFGDNNFFFKNGKIIKFCKNYKIFKVWCSCKFLTLWFHIFVRFALSLTISKIRTFFKKNPKRPSMLLLQFIILLITNLCPFRAISYRFWDKNFLAKMAKLDKFGKILKNYKIFKVWCSCIL